MEATEYAEGCLIYLHTLKLGIRFAELIGMFRAQDLALQVSLLYYFVFSSPWGGEKGNLNVLGIS